MKSMIAFLSYQGHKSNIWKRHNGGKISISQVFVLSYNEIYTDFLGLVFSWAMRVIPYAVTKSWKIRGILGGSVYLT